MTNPVWPRSFLGALYITELLGAVLMFIGFLRATTLTKVPEGWCGV